MASKQASHQNRFTVIVFSQKLLSLIIEKKYLDVYFRRFWAEIYYFKGINLGRMPMTFCGGKKGTRILFKNTLNFV